ncbi:hypothetical protein [Undibacterium umbellatum]|uniref:hypothetical protein n=1 Tax=Undibacterium umbellatum TaxID=2762300 RepID=UPI00164C72DB|nr:hypothetical protein [Undibacterium umbellatum]
MKIGKSASIFRINLATTVVFLNIVLIATQTAGESVKECGTNLDIAFDPLETLVSTSIDKCLLTDARSSNAVSNDTHFQE